MNTTENLLLLNWITATGTLLLEIFLFIFSLILIYFYFTSPEDKRTMRHFLDKVLKIQNSFLHKFVSKENFSLERVIIYKIFFLSLISSILTLVYSEIFGLIPCALCWFSRVFMYGILLISGIAIFARNEAERRGIMRYILVFSILGALVSIYHHALQITAGSNSHLPCPVSGGDCAKMFIFEYDHITFPWMGLIAFLSFILLYVFAKIIDQK